MIGPPIPRLPASSRHRLESIEQPSPPEGVVQLRARRRLNIDDGGGGLPTGCLRGNPLLLLGLGGGPHHVLNYPRRS
jgi:hypothetical protein